MRNALILFILIFNIKSLRSQIGVDQTEFHYRIYKYANTIVNGKQGDGKWEDLKAFVTVDIAKQNISISGKYAQIFHWHDFHNDDDSLYTRTFFACKDQDSVGVVVSVIQELVNGQSVFNLVVHYNDSQRFYLMDEYLEKNGNEK